MALRQYVVLGVLLVILLLSAMAVVYFKHGSRQLFIEIQKQEAALDQYEVQWGQLQLELTTLTEDKRVELIARQLKMLVPSRDKIIYIKP